MYEVFLLCEHHTKGGIQMYMTQNISKAFDVLDAIGKTASRTEKEQLLSSNKDNMVLQTILLITYNPFVVFGIKKIPQVTITESSEVETLELFNEFNALLDKLATRELTGNAAIKALTNTLGKCTTERELHWYSMIIKRDLKIGITDKTINKVFKDLIPVFTCMLAHPFTSKKLPKKVVVDPKLDGYRCLLTIDEAGVITLRSRNGKELTGYTAIEEDAKHLTSGYVYDGEIMSEGTFADTQKTAFKKTTNKSGVLHLFDAITIQEFKTGEFFMKYGLRRKALSNIILSAPPLTHVKLVSGVELHTDKSGLTGLEEVIMSMHKQYLEQGYEGTMVKDAEGLYAKKRTWAVQKLKDMETLDLTVIGVSEGVQGTALEGTLGALIVDYKGKAVNVGSGYTLSERNKIWATKEDVINRTIEVQYFEESTDSKTGEKSLRFPVFKGFRGDK
ncbi:DNA ligase [Exiguobacterium phage vB_EalM-132]|nr:DNA ligase [Exiguobacterium phage vB_EalM-132]